MPTKQRKLVIFNDDNDIVDMILDVKNWDKNFDHVVNMGIQKWNAQTDIPYKDFIQNHLTSAGYKFDVIPNADDTSDDYT